MDLEIAIKSCKPISEFVLSILILLRRKQGLLGIGAAHLYLVFCIKDLFNIHCNLREALNARAWVFGRA